MTTIRMKANGIVGQGVPVAGMTAQAVLERPGAPCLEQIGDKLKAASSGLQPMPDFREVAFSRTAASAYDPDGSFPAGICT